MMFFINYREYVDFKWRMIRYLALKFVTFKKLTLSGVLKNIPLDNIV